MSAETVSAGSTLPVARFLIQPFTARTWKETLYLLLSMPVGILTFVRFVLARGLARRSSGRGRQLAPAGSDHRRVLAVLAYLDGR